MGKVKQFRREVSEDLIVFPSTNSSHTIWWNSSRNEDLWVSGGNAPNNPNLGNVWLASLCRSVRWALGTHLKGWRREIFFILQIIRRGTILTDVLQPIRKKLPFNLNLGTVSDNYSNCSVTISATQTSISIKYLLPNLNFSKYKEQVLPLILYWREILSLLLRQESRVWITENIMLRTTCWRKE